MAYGFGKKRKKTKKFPHTASSDTIRMKMNGVSERKDEKCAYRKPFAS